eukprot:3415782-Rhodomonas_salina.1
MLLRPPYEVSGTEVCPATTRREGPACTVSTVEVEHGVRAPGTVRYRPTGALWHVRTDIADGDICLRCMTSTDVARGVICLGAFDCMCGTGVGYVRITRKNIVDTVLTAAICAVRAVLTSGVCAVRERGVRRRRVQDSPNSFRYCPMQCLYNTWGCYYNLCTLLMYDVRYCRSLRVLLYPMPGSALWNAVRSCYAKSGTAISLSFYDAISGTPLICIPCMLCNVRHCHHLHYARAAVLYS